MDLARVDTSATQGRSALHRAAPWAKLSAFALLLGAVVISNNVLVVASIAISLMGCVAVMRLPGRAITALAAYPVLFGALYAFGTGAGWLTGALIVTKAAASALCALLLVFTTPYPQVFAPIQRVVPGVIGDVLLMTYRSLFLLLEKFGHTLTAARLRAGVIGASPVRSAATITRSLAGVMLYSVDLSQRTYDVMRLRGYDDRLVVTPLPSQSRALDLTVLACSLLALSVALAWRVAWQVLGPYAWAPLVLAMTLAALCFAIALRSGDRR